MSGPEARLRDRIGGGRAVALIDGNSFYCSCERVFDPKLAEAFVPPPVFNSTSKLGLKRAHAETGPDAIFPAPEWPTVKEAIASDPDLQED